MTFFGQAGLASAEFANGLGQLMGIGRRIAFSALGLMFASLNAASAASVTIRDAVIAGFRAPVLMLEGPGLDESKVLSAFADDDDTAALLSLSFDRLEAAELLFPADSTSTTATKILNGVVIDGLYNGTARRVQSDYGALNGPDATVEGIRFSKAVVENVLLVPWLDTLRGASDTAPRAALPGFSSFSVERLTIGSSLTGFTWGITSLSMVGLTINASDHAGNLPRKVSLAFAAAFADFQPGSSLAAKAFLSNPANGELTFLWDDKAASLTLESAEIRSAQFGKLSLGFSLGGVTASVFSTDELERMSGLIGLTVAEASLAIEDTGLLNTLLFHAGMSQLKTGAAARAETVELAQLVVPALLGQTSDAEAASEAITKFIGSSGTLSISAAGKDGPLGMGDFVAIEGPADILPKLKLVVSSSR